jgi:hypothetical protein
MEIQIKKAIKSGNSSAVVLPRAWLNKEVRVELVKKTPEIILMDTLEILNKYIPLKSVISVCLAGSYARGEEDENSDIDVLVITEDIDKELIVEGIYNILIVSYQLLFQKLNENLFPVGQMIKEGKPLLNEDYLNSININVTKKNVKWYLDTTLEKINIIRGYINHAKKIEEKTKKKQYLEDKIAYTLILRIRTLEIIKRLIENKDYSKKEFINLIKKISKGNNSYERYLASKNKQEDEKKLSLDEAEKLYNYLKEDYEKVKKLVRMEVK